jgi:hypothetical protein
MITPEMFVQFLSAAVKESNIKKADIESLADIRTLEFDNSLSREQRLLFVMKELKNPFCFRYGNMGIQIEFDNNAPSLHEVLTDFMVRKKSGV